ncbi:hypothetical protein F4677DRAFT_430091 [Hypoxylon crocopeplum]|nr:hypothetical protein F4677DRAFT_430091 [Hypoxylon crocopeplum]
MPSPRTSVSEARDAPRAARTPRPRESSSRVPRFFHRLRSKMSRRRLLKWMPQKPSSNGEDSTRSTMQQGSARAVNLLQKPTCREGITNENNASSSKWLTESITQQIQDNRDHPEGTGRSATCLFHPNSRADKLNSTGDILETNICSSQNAKPNRQRRSWLETNLSRSRLLSEVFPASLSKKSPTASPESPTLVKKPKLIEEREKTLRILESRDKPVGSQPYSPATIRHMRSYQLATDPRIDPQQYSDFQQFLEHEIATDLTLRLQLWKSLTRDLGNRAGLVIDPDLDLPVDGSTSGNGRRKSRNSYVKSQSSRRVRWEDCATTDHAVERQNSNWIGQNWVHDENRENRRLYSFPSGYDRGVPVEQSTQEGNGRVRGTGPATYSELSEHSTYVTPDEKALQQPSKASKRQSWSDQCLRRRISSERRRASTSSFTNLVAQYIRPEMPATIYSDKHSESTKLDTPETTKKPKLA